MPPKKVTKTPARRRKRAPTFLSPEALIYTKKLLVSAAKEKEEDVEAKKKGEDAAKAKAHATTKVKVTDETDISAHKTAISLRSGGKDPKGDEGDEGGDKGDGDKGDKDGDGDKDGKDGKDDKGDDGAKGGAPADTAVKRAKGDDDDGGDDGKDGPPKKKVKTTPHQELLENEIEEARMRQNMIDISNIRNTSSTRDIPGITRYPPEEAQLPLFSQVPISHLDRTVGDKKGEKLYIDAQHLNDLISATFEPHFSQVFPPWHSDFDEHFVTLASLLKTKKESMYRKSLNYIDWMMLKSAIKINMPNEGPAAKRKLFLSFSILDSL